MGIIAFLKNKIAELCGNTQPALKDSDFSKYYQKWDENYDEGLGYEYFKICTNPQQFPLYNSLGIRLAGARKSAKLTQADAAKAIGISAGTLSSYENNNTIPSDEKIKIISQLYEIPFEFFKNGYVADLSTHIKCAKLCNEDKYLESLHISARAAKKMFPEMLSESDREVCELIFFHAWDS